MIHVPFLKFDSSGLPQSSFAPTPGQYSQVQPQSGYGQGQSSYGQGAPQSQYGHAPPPQQRPPQAGQYGQPSAYGQGQPQSGYGQSQSGPGVFGNPQGQQAGQFGHSGYGQAQGGQPQYGQPQSQYGEQPQGQYGQPPQGQYGQPPQGQYGQQPQGGQGSPIFGLLEGTVDHMNLDTVLILGSLCQGPGYWRILQSCIAAAASGSTRPNAQVAKLGTRLANPDGNCDGYNQNFPV